MELGSVKLGEVFDLNGLINKLPAGSLGTQQRYIDAIIRAFPRLLAAGINTPLRLAHFLAQGVVETNYLRSVSENLNYSAERLIEIFPRYFPTLDEARAYARKPERIANRVYANRLGNGDEASGDGWRYRGRGFFQLTGRDNYKHFGDIAKVDLVGKPDVLEKDLVTSVRVAADYFAAAGLGAFADRNDARAVSRGVNRGDPTSRLAAHGETERLNWTSTLLGLVPTGVAGAAPAAAEDGAATTLKFGSRGDAVALLQRRLAMLGYAVGAADGIFGRATERAVKAFQDENGLAATGIVDAATQTAIEDALADPARRRNEPVAQPAGDGRVEVGTAGAAATGVGAVAVANETGTLQAGIELAGKVIADARGEGESPAEPSAETPTGDGPETAAPDPGAPAPEAADPQPEETETPAADDLPPAEDLVADPDEEGVDAEAADPGASEPDAAEPEAEQPAAETPARSEESLPTTNESLGAPPPASADPYRERGDFFSTVLFVLIILIGLYLLSRAFGGGKR